MPSLCVRLLICAFLYAASSATAAEWELGFSGGYGVAKDAAISNSSGQISAGIKPGIAFTVFGGNQVRPYLSGEVRYTYRQGDFRVSGNGAEAIFSGESHTVHYDFLFQRSSAQERRIQPYVAAGAGIRYFRGTGQELRTQALNRFAILTKTNEVRALLSVGAGVRCPVTRVVSVRAEFRDYISPFPQDVIAPVPVASSSGWLHDFVPMIGLGFTF